mmetsp:Transcript_5299/g.19071  ORF Transcript_5299/g.19071 Transcript_5299/m.19071 type:complete len:339 (-) Transcript_5299:126-1142(-)
MDRMEHPDPGAPQVVLCQDPSRIPHVLCQTPSQLSRIQRAGALLGDPEQRFGELGPRAAELTDLRRPSLRHEDGAQVRVRGHGFLVVLHTGHQIRVGLKALLRELHRGQHEILPIQPAVLYPELVQPEELERDADRQAAGQRFLGVVHEHGLIGGERGGFPGVDGVADPSFGVHEDEGPAADPRGERVLHAEAQRGRHRGVRGVAASPKRLCPHLRAIALVRRDHSVFRAHLPWPPYVVLEQALLPLIPVVFIVYHLVFLSAEYSRHEGLYRDDGEQKQAKRGQDRPRFPPSQHRRVVYQPPEPAALAFVHHRRFITTRGRSPGEEQAAIFRVQVLSL